ncbi:MAG: Uma2 family endonuclease [Lachnospiraceae bacterium]|nr:Uma2 family endonuclease [Lachnospiraceae bacterium]
MDMDTSKPDRSREYTTDDIDRMPEEMRVELIDGKLYDMAEPTVSHQRISFNIARLLADHIDANPDSCKGCEVFCPAPGVYINKKNFVVPDVMVVCDRDKLSVRGCEGAPEFVIEVASPSNKTMDYLHKLVVYKNSGVKLYWIVDPMDESITVYDMRSKNEEGYLVEKYSFSDRVPVSLCEGLEVDFGKMGK